MTQWYSARELAGVPGMPETVRGVIHRSSLENWQFRRRTGRGGGREYNIASMPVEARRALAGQVAQAGTDEHGMAEGRKLALADKVIKLHTSRAAETRLKDACLLSERERERDQARAAILADWTLYRRMSGEPVNESLISYAILYNLGSRPVQEQYKRISAPTLRNWRRALKINGHLGARYGNRAGTGKIDRQPELKSFIVAMMTEFPHCDSNHVLKGIKARFNGSEIDLPSMGRLNAWMERWKRENAQIFTAITSPDKWKNSYMSAFGDAAENIIKLNQVWQFDGTPADVMFVDGRHTLNGVLDVYSRRGKILVIPTARAQSVTSLLRRALLDWGIPETVSIDNGSDYVAYHTTRVFNELEIQTDVCPPFSPWKKPFIERFFRTFSHDLVELLPGYVGHNVAERKDIESRKAFSERLFKKDQVIELKMTSEEFQSFCDDWCNNIYHRAKHDALGCSPWEMANAWKEPVRRISDERALDILLQPCAGNNGKRTVAKKGIMIDLGLYIAPELGLHVGRDVRVFEVADDLGRVIVKDYESGEFICVAECPERTGISPAEVAAKAHEIQKRHVQEAKAELKRAAKQMNVREIVKEIREHASGETAKIVTLPRPHEEYTTPALEAAAEAAEIIDEYRPETRGTRTEDRVAFLREALAKAEAEIEAEKKVEAERMAREAEVDPDTARYIRWKGLDAEVKGGAKLGGDDERFYRVFRESATFRAMSAMEEDFGEFWVHNTKEARNG